MFQKIEEIKKYIFIIHNISSFLGLEGLVKDAQRKQQVHEAGKAVTEKLKNDGHTDRSAKAYYKEFQKVVEVADVVLQVLDARDPLGKAQNLKIQIFQCGCYSTIAYMVKMESVMKITPWGAFT